MIEAIEAKDTKRPLCSECNSNVANTIEKLCRTCNITTWNDKHGKDISQIDPSEPTSHPPGSFEKLLVLCARANARLPLFNKFDNQIRKQSKSA